MTHPGDPVNPMEQPIDQWPEGDLKLMSRTICTLTPEELREYLEKFIKEKHQGPIHCPTCGRFLVDMGYEGEEND